MDGGLSVGQAQRRFDGAGLSESQIQALMFERQWWRYEGSKDKAIRDLFQMDPTRYYQLLSSLIERDEALAFDPRLVGRLRRQRDERHRARSARRLIQPDPVVSTDKL
jgi:hypothetical protein